MRSAKDWVAASHRQPITKSTSATTILEGRCCRMWSLPPLFVWFYRKTQENRQTWGHGQDMEFAFWESTWFGADGLAFWTLPPCFFCVFLFSGKPKEKLPNVGGTGPLERDTSIFRIPLANSVSLGCNLLGCSTGVAGDSPLINGLSVLPDACLVLGRLSFGRLGRRISLNKPRHDLGVPELLRRTFRLHN